MPGGGDLYFCAHHGREHAERLRSVAIEIQDSTGALSDSATTPPATDASSSTEA